MRIFESLDHFATLIPQNANSYRQSYPLESKAAEAVHQGIFSLINDSKFLNENISTMTTATLAFGAHSSWINAVNMTMAGHIDAGFSEIRRAIEFTCYASKVKNSDARAMDWIKQKNDPDAMKRFSGKFQIPTAYTNNKYRHLHALLVTYHLANYHGAHGNFESMLGKIQTTEGHKFSYQANQEMIIIVSPYIVLNGYRILQAFNIILSDLIEPPQNFNATMEYVDRSIRELRIELAEIRYEGNIPDIIRKGILMDDSKEDDKAFKEMIEKEQLRRNKNS